MLVLEDLHSADDSTLALITHLSQRHSDLPLLIVATFRESDVDPSPSLSRTLEGLIRGRLASQLRPKDFPQAKSRRCCMASAARHRPMLSRMRFMPKPGAIHFSSRNCSSTLGRESTVR